ncbi:MAG: excinuclease ABC subunit UvrC [Simkaniaceae bacterium]|nr:excinuclease ABC subunit UvrC [Simkaniaceae bacterium]
MTEINLESLPKEPGVYLMKDGAGRILYIGKAKQLRRRVKQYFVPGRDGRMMVPFLTCQVKDIETLVTFSEKEALLLENNLIKQHQPKYNVLLKDDKTFISLIINHKHQWPMIKVTRYRGRPKNHALHFGPYTSASAARQTLDLMTRIFKLRQCSNRELTSRTRPCLLYSIKRCLAPCVDKCTRKEYDQEVKHAIDFLKGKDRQVVNQLKKERDKAAENLEYERAGALQKTMEQIEHVTRGRQSIIRSKGKDCDIFALYHEGTRHIIVKLMYREGRLVGADHFTFIELASTDEEIWESFLLQHYQEKGSLEVLLPIQLKQQKALEDILCVSLHSPQKGEKYHLLKLAEKNAKALFTDQQSKEELLLDLQETCDLSRCPIRIECFDTSNISGTDLVACMVGFTEGKRDKEKTRLFKITKIHKSDDYGAMREVLMRHYTKAKEKDELPDLTLIDGGKGQLNVALEVFKELDIANVDVISLAKEKGRHDKGLNFEKIFVPHKRDPLFLSPRSPTLFVLQQIRDEAHRVAISYHRKRRSKRLIHNELDEIPGIGQKKRNLLLKNFGSVKQVKGATKEALKKIAGLNSRDIDAIIKFQRK